MKFKRILALISVALGSCLFVPSAHASHEVTAKSLTATSTGPTKADVSFVMDSDYLLFGASYSSYTATSSPGGIQASITQASISGSRSGTISISGLTSGISYTFTVTTTYTYGGSQQTSISNASNSITTTGVTAEELAEQAAQAARAAAIKREADKRSAREEIIERFKISEKASLELFNRAEIFGITPANIDEFYSEILALPKESQREITQVLKIARKYEILGIIASERVKTIYSNSLIEIGLIPTDSRNKSTLTRVVKELSQAERSTYASIKDAIEVEMAVIQARKDRLAKALAINASRGNG